MKYSITMERTQRVAFSFTADNDDEALKKAAELNLDGQALVDRWNSFCKCCENGIRVWEVKYQHQDGSVDFLWYGNFVDEAEAKRRNQAMEAAGLKVLGMRPVNRLPTNKMYLELIKEANEEAGNERTQK